MASVFRRPRAFQLLQGRFLHGADTIAYANVSGQTQMQNTNALCSSVRADMIAYAKPSGGHYCICNNVLRIVLHRGRYCMRHRAGQTSWGRFLTRKYVMRASISGRSIHERTPTLRNRFLILKCLA